MIHVHLDWETFGELDLKKVGVHNYVRHKSFAPLCLAFAVDDEKPSLIRPFLAGVDDFVSHRKLQHQRTERLKGLAARDDTIFIAHNAGFEQDVWQKEMAERQGFAALPPHRWSCTMAKALAHGLPASLDEVSQVLKLKERKDSDGHKIMQKLSRPRKPSLTNPDRRWTHETAPENFKRLYLYCLQDVRTERELDKNLRDLSEGERRIWLIDQRINQAGIHVDVPYVETAIRWSEKHRESVIERFREATGNVVAKPSQRGQFLKWSAANGYQLRDTKQTTVKAALARRDVPAVVRDALSIFQEASKGSLTKYSAFLQRADGNGCIREIIQYCGAHTHRFAGRGIQIHNLKRPTIAVGLLAEIIESGKWAAFDFLYGDNHADYLSSGIRPAIIPANHKKFYGADYGQIESRILAWLASEVHKLEKFRAGIDVYCDIASDVYGRVITKDDDKERQTGKVSDLSFGYEGGIAAGAKMGKGYDVDWNAVYPELWKGASHQERDSADYHYMLYLKKRPKEPVTREEGRVINILKDRWRALHPKTIQYWRDLDAAAIDAVLGQTRVKCGNVLWFMHKQFLCCRAPSGGVIMYPYPKVEIGRRGKRTLTYKRVDPETKQWSRTSSYGGKLTQNLVEKVGRDILCAAMVDMEDRFPWAFHVHDEGISQVDLDEDALDEYGEMMLVKRDWMEGLPLTVNVWEGARYGK